MRQRPWVRVLAAVAALGAGASIATASSASSSRSSCTLGQATAGATQVEQTAVASAQAAFVRSLSGLSAADRKAAGADFATDLQAYVYGFPIVMVRRTARSFPPNRMVSIGTLADTSTVTVVAPNHDTLYSVAQVDLTGGPMVVSTPPTHGRYSVIQLIDGFTNATYVGDGSHARTGELAVIVPPGWHGTVPAGAVVVHSATKLIWLLGRTLATGNNDTTAAVALLSHYSLETLSAYVGGARLGPLVLTKFPTRPRVLPPSGTAFFDELGADLAADAPPAADACAVKAFKRSGAIVSGSTGLAANSPAARARIAAAAAAPGVFSRIVGRGRHLAALLRNGWTTTPPDTAKFGAHYLDRALVAAIGLGANTNAKALYLTEDRDSRLRAMSGAHGYTVHFAKGQLPPVGQFWSLTLYDSRILFYANPLNRYALGDRSPGLKRDAHGGLTIYVSHSNPGGAKSSNWLPAPAGAFSLYLRLYEPKPSAARWAPPSVVRVR